MHRILTPSLESTSLPIECTPNAKSYRTRPIKLSPIRHNVAVLASDPSHIGRDDERDCARSSYLAAQSLPMFLRCLLRAVSRRKLPWVWWRRENAYMWMLANTFRNRRTKRFRAAEFQQVLRLQKITDDS